MPKYGAEFVSPWHSKPVTFNFADATTLLRDEGAL